jgi:hypothetical protein
MGELELLLPDKLKNRALASGKELVLPFIEALAAITIATNHQIAILGVDAFEVKTEGLHTVYLADASRYVSFTGDWTAYVGSMNAEAAVWIKDIVLEKITATF